MPGPLYTQSVLDLVHKLLFPLYTQIFLHQFCLWSPIFLYGLCVCMFCNFFCHPVPQKSSCEVQEFVSLFFYLLANRKKKNQQIYKCPFYSYLLKSLFFFLKKKVHRWSSSTGFPWRDTSQRPWQKAAGKKRQINYKYTKTQIAFTKLWHRTLEQQCTTPTLLWIICHCFNKMYIQWPHFSHMINCLLKKITKQMTLKLVLLHLHLKRNKKNADGSIQHWMPHLIPGWPLWKTCRA